MRNWRSSRSLLDASERFDAKSNADFLPPRHQDTKKGKDERKEFEEKVAEATGAAIEAFSVISVLFYSNLLFFLQLPFLVSWCLGGNSNLPSPPTMAARGCGLVRRD